MTAFIHLGEVQMRQGDLPAAIATWERAIEVAPDRAYLAFAQLERAYAQANLPTRFAELCRKLTEASPREWRARLALARHLETQGRPHDALELLLEALEHNPHALAIHQAIWNTLSALDLPRLLVARYIEVTRRVRVLPGSARVHAVPLPQHGTAVAVPALPRMEHLRRRAHRAGDG